MTPERFTRLVEEAVREIPRRLRAGPMTNVAVVVEDEPADDLLEEMEVEAGETLYSLYRGRRSPTAVEMLAMPCRIGSWNLAAIEEESCTNEDEMQLHRGDRDSRVHLRDERRTNRRNEG